MTTENSNTNPESSANDGLLYVIITNRSNQLVSQEATRLLAAAEKDKGQKRRIVVALPDEFHAGCRSWADPLGNLNDQVTVEIVSFNPGETIADRQRAADQLANAIEGSKMNGLLFNWHGAVPGRGFEKMEDSGLVQMVQYKVTGLAVLLDTLLKRSLMSERSRVIVAGSEAARGIPEMGFPLPKFKDSIESFVAMMNGSTLNPTDYNVLYGSTETILTLYIGSMARKHPNLYFCTVSPGFTSDSLNYNMGLERGWRPYLRMKLLTLLFPLLQSQGLGIDYRVSSQNFENALTGNAEWKLPSGALGGPDNESGMWVDQSTVAGGAQLSDPIKQDLAYDALHRFVGRSKEESTK